MTQLIFKDNIDSSKMDILLHLLKSWNIELEIKDIPQQKEVIDPFAEVRGIWVDYDVNDMMLREKAFGVVKK